jgi:phage-related protein
VTSQLLGNAIVETGRSIWNAIGKVSEFISKMIHGIASLIKSIVSPIFEVLIKPVAEAIQKIVSGVLNLITLPKHPVWYGVAILAIGIAIKTQM